MKKLVGAPDFVSVAIAVGTTVVLLAGALAYGTGEKYQDPYGIQALIIFMATCVHLFLMMNDLVIHAWYGNAQNRLLPPNKESRRQTVALLQALEVEKRTDAMPSQSGGELHLVTIARGLVNRPPIILADEAGKPLDSERTLAVIRILNEMAEKFGTAIIIVTDDKKN